MPRIPFREFNEHAPVDISHLNLPHWTQDGATYFVTFRLGDSVPVSLLRESARERETWLELNRPPWSKEVVAEYRGRFAAREDHWLDQGHGECVLRQEPFRDEVEKYYSAAAPGTSIERPLSRAVSFSRKGAALFAHSTGPG